MAGSTKGHRDLQAGSSAFARDHSDHPADAFRVFNLSAAEAVAVAGGIGGAAGAIPLWQSAASLFVWPLAAIALAVTAFQKVRP